MSIIILNWNTWRYTLECLESLFKIRYPNYSVILVDNGSSDESIERIQDYCAGREIAGCTAGFSHNYLELITIEDPDAENIGQFQGQLGNNQTLILIKNKRNEGFAEGNNIGIRFSLKMLPSDFVLLLNNDTVVEVSFLNHLVSGAEKYPSAGFFGPKIYYYDYGGRKDIVSHAGGILNFWTGRSIHIGDMRVDIGQYNKERTVDYLTGACLLVRREVIEQIGLLPKEYFLYWEDTAWCFKGRKAGYPCVYIPESIIWHHICASASGPLAVYYMTRNRFWFIRQNAGSIQKISFFFFFFTIAGWYNLGKILLHPFQRREKVATFLLGIGDGLGRLPGDKH